MKPANWIAVAASSVVSMACAGRGGGDGVGIGGRGAGGSTSGGTGGSPSSGGAGGGPGGSPGGASGGNGGIGGAADAGANGGAGRGLGGVGPGGITGGAGRGGSGGAETGRGGSDAGSSGAAGGGIFAAPVIINDRFWRDTAGAPIYSQGGGVLQVGDTFYWYGVRYGGAVTYAANPTGKNGDTSFAGVTIYSSKNCVDWKLENTVRFTNAGGWFGRLGVVYHAGTKKYVLVSQGGGGVYFATSDTPNGTFTFNSVQTSPPGIANNATGDQTTFQDDDGKAYVISSSAEGRSHRYVSPLRTSDYLRMENAIEVDSGGGREGNCMFKYNGYYYLCSSDLHGWNASQSYCVMAPNITGPYSDEFVVDGTERDFSHVTQTGFFINVKGSAQNTIIFAGDRWSDFAGNGIGYNQWMPLSFSGRMPRMESLTHWAIDVVTGAWSVDLRNNYILNPSFEADRVSMTKPAGWTTSNGTNTQSGHTGRWSWQLTGTSSLSQKITTLPNSTYTLTLWVRTDATGAQVRVNGFGGAERTLAIPRASAWTQISLDGIAVSNGQCDVTVTTSGQSLSVDDFNFSQK
jgi:hypothetical protein